MFEEEECQNRAAFCGNICYIFFELVSTLAAICQNYRQRGECIERTLSLEVIFRKLNSVKGREL